MIVGVSVLRLVWSKNNDSMNFRGGKMLKVNSVVGRGGHQTPVIQSFLNFKELKLFSWKEKN